MVASSPRKKRKLVDLRSHEYLARQLDEARDRANELEEQLQTAENKLVASERVGMMERRNEEIRRLNEQYAAQEREIEELEEKFSEMQAAADHHKMFWQKAEERERRLKEQLEAVRRWFMDEPWKGDFDRSSFGGHDYTPAERAIGYGTHRDPRFLPPLLAELAPEPSKTP